MAVAIDDLYWIEVEGASEAELRRGMAAARVALEEDGIIDPEPMFHALFKREGLEMGNRGYLTSEERRLCRAWERADAAAHDACCGRWRNPPGTAFLSLAASCLGHEESLIERGYEVRDKGPRYDAREPAHPELPLMEAA